jgi:predicted dehydrogenase
MALGEKMKGKFSLAVGFQIRYASPYVLLEKRIREGQIGSMVSGQIHYFASNIGRPAFADKSVDERRLRNWIYEKTISGDIIVEQNIHIIDCTNWLLNGRPLKAYGRNGRAGRADDRDCSSHYNCVFTYPKDVHISFSSTQYGKAAWGVGMQYYGTRGIAEARYDAPVRISGERPGYSPAARRPSTSKPPPAGRPRRLDDADANSRRRSSAASYRQPVEWCHAGAVGLWRFSEDGSGDGRRHVANAVSTEVYDRRSTAQPHRRNNQTVVSSQ